MRNHRLVHLAFSIVVASGCSQTASESATAVVQIGASTVAATLPSLGGSTTKATSAAPGEPAPPAEAPSATLPPAAPAPAAPLLEMGDLFAPPKIVVPVVTVEPEPEPELPPEPVVEEPKKEQTLPPLRLIGFVEVEGLKALLSVAGNLNVLTIGESAEGLQIIAIEPPQVTLRYGQDGEEFQMNLYDQPWFHPAGAFAGDRKTIGGKPVFSKGSSGSNAAPMSAGPGSTNGPGTGTPIGVPRIPGVGPDGLPGVPGFGGMIGPPGAPGVNANGLPGSPAFPGAVTPSNGNAKNSKKSSKSSASSTGLPGIPSPPSTGGIPGGSFPGVGGTLPGTLPTK